MKYLLETTESYRVDNEAAAQEIIEKAKSSSQYLLVRYTTTYKEKKVKGEVEDSWYKVTLVKKFTDEKEPDGSIEINYEKGSAF